MLITSEACAYLIWHTFLIKLDLYYFLHLHHHLFIFFLLLLQTPNQTNHLKCYYSDMGSYWLKIQPIKVEVHNEKPFIAIYHHLLSDSESDAIREMAAPMVSFVRDNYLVNFGLNTYLIVIINFLLCSD